MGYKETLDETLDLINRNWDEIKNSLVFEGTGKEVLKEVARCTPYEEVEHFRTDEAIGEMILTAFMIGKKEALEELKKIRE